MKISIQFLASCIASVLMLSAGAAHADLIITPADGRVYVDRGTYVICQDNRYNPPPPYNPPQPPPPYYPPPPNVIIREVLVRADRYCLRSIPPMDGRSLSREAGRCDQNSPDRYRLEGDCRILRVDVDHRLAEEVISKANTVIHSDQREVIRNASADKTFECRIVR